MRKLLHLETYTALILVLIFTSTGNSQEISITGTSSSPFFSFGPLGPVQNSPVSSRFAYIYPQSLLTAIPTGATLTKLQFERGGTETATMPAGNNLKIYLLNTGLTDWGSNALDWQTAIASATLVYNADPALTIGNSSGWKEFFLNPLFSYSGNNLAVFAEYSNLAITSPLIRWQVTFSSEQPAYQANQTKYQSNYSATMPASLAGSEALHPNLKITYATSPCLTPPAAGNARTTASLPVCANTSADLTLENYSWGVGQNYQWESSPDSIGPYTAFGSISPSFNKTISPSESKWYRLAVMCNGFTSHSTPVYIPVKPHLNGTFTLDNTLPTGNGNFRYLDDVNNAMGCGVNGPVVIKVKANQVFFAGNEFSISGTASTPITFKKDGIGANPKFQAKVLVSGTHYNCVIKLNGVDYYTFDGIDFENLGSSSEGHLDYVIFIINKQSGTRKGSQYNVFKNGVVSSQPFSRALKGIYIYSNSALSHAETNSYNKFINMTVQYSGEPYYLESNSANYPDLNNEITADTVGAGKIFDCSGNVIISGKGQKNLTIRNNEISNITADSRFPLNIISLTDAKSSATITNNYIHDINFNTGINGILCSSGDTLIVTGNRFAHLESIGLVRAMRVSTTSFLKVSSNIIYDLKSTGTSPSAGVYGIDIGGAPQVTITNNMISGLKAPNYSIATASVVGLSLVGNSTHLLKVYHNTVYLNDSSNAAGYSNAGISASSTPTLDLRNNLIVNKSVAPNGNRIVAFWKTSSNLNFHSGTNNNLYYAGTPSSKNLIYYNGTTSAQTIAAYKAISGLSPREKESVTENVIFSSIVDGKIKLDSTLGSLAESGGTESAAIANDFENTIRGPYPLTNQENHGGFKPDIGADEFDGFPLPVQLCPPSASVSIQSKLTGTIYQWQVNSGGGFVNISDNIFYSGSNTSTLQLNSIPSSWYNHRYRCVVDGVNDLPNTIKFVNCWTGVINNDWSSPGNWSCGVVPDMYTDVVILSGDVVISSNVTIGSLNIQTGASLTIASGFTITLTR